MLNLHCLYTFFHFKADRYIDYCFTYSLTDQRTAKNVERIVGIFQTCFCLSERNDFFVDIPNVNEKEPKTLTSGTTFKFSHYEFRLKKKNIPNDNLHSYISIIKIFENLIQNANIFKNDELICRNSKHDFFYYFYAEYGFIYKHISEIFKKNFKTDESMILFLNEEMQKYGIGLDLLNQILALVHLPTIDSIYDTIKPAKTVLFLLTKKYVETKLFKKLFYQAERMEKKIFLVKLHDFDFDFKKEYEHVHIHDISKHEDCNYEGYLTRRLLDDFTNGSLVVS